MDVVLRREKRERRLAKRRKVVSDDEEELAHEVRRMDMDVGGARQHRVRARPKKRANRRMLTVEVSDSSVEKMVASIVNTSEVAASEVMRPVEIGVPSEVLVEVPVDIPAEPLKEGTELVVAQIGGTVVEAEGITLPTSPMEEVRPEEGKNTSGKDVKTLEITFPDFLQDSVVPLLKYLDEKESGRCVELEKTCGGLRISNENAQKVTVHLMARLEKSREAYEAAIKRSERLITTTDKQEKKHVEEVATLEIRRAEEVRIADELRGKIAEAKTTEEDLCSKILEIEAKCEMEFRYAEELSTNLFANQQIRSMKSS
ncbi:hypothetical protein AXG93_4201s1260 [Marchantia polymorpha subsp. ruderalis]|uniref:Uncharacterized protein n=1 Tax=Marchantia polymorpha subsp. ruderalis TaxID=1480154 RepID=A0A176WDI7_MARPO|nr:hypothetical protein AXG93_4201s1260 [Marchantia polymorpha subsp. ruderalis]